MEVRKRYKTLLCYALYFFFVLRYSIYTEKGTVLTVLLCEFSQTVFTMLPSTWIKRVNAFSTPECDHFRFPACSRVTPVLIPHQHGLVLLVSALSINGIIQFVPFSVWLLSFTIVFVGFLCIVNIAILCSFSFLFSISL